MNVKLLCLFLVTVECKVRHSGVYTECCRRVCSKVSDREVGWEFDQPVPVYAERDGGTIRKQLEEDRINSQ